MIDILILVLAFLAVLLTWVALADSVAKARKKLASDPGALHNDVLQAWYGPVFYAGSELFDKTGDSARDMKRRLLLAGQPKGFVAGEHFLGALVVLASGIFVFNFCMLFIISGFSIINIAFSLGIGVAVFFLGKMWVDSLIADRKVSMLKGFPYFMDTAVMAMGAGATFVKSMEVYVRENKSEPLSEELSICLSEIEIGKTLIEALESLDRRIAVPPINNALKAIIQGEKLGTSIQSSLNEQAEVLRFSRSQEAERIAEEMKIKMQGPAMMLLASILLLILGPALVEMATSDVFG